MNMSDKIRVLIADDHPVVLEGLRAVINKAGDMLVIGDASNGGQVIENCRLLHPDIIVLDLIMPRRSGLDVLKEIRAVCPDTRILILTAVADDGEVLKAIRSGALGY